MNRSVVGTILAILIVAVFAVLVSYPLVKMDVSVPSYPEGCSVIFNGQIISPGGQYLVSEDENSITISGCGEIRGYTIRKYLPFSYLWGFYLGEETKIVFPGEAPVIYPPAGVMTLAILINDQKEEISFFLFRY